MKEGGIYKIEGEGGSIVVCFVTNRKTKGYLIRAVPNLLWVPGREYDVSCFEVDSAFCVYFPLGAAVRRKIATRIGFIQAEWLGKIPPLRRPICPFNGRMKWRLVDGDQESTVETLSDADRRRGLDELWNDTLLIEMVVTGWNAHDYV